MKNFYIVYNPDKDEDNRITSELTAYIESQNGACKAMDCYSFSACDKQHVTDELESFDCILVLGGWNTPQCGIQCQPCGDSSVRDKSWNGGIPH